MKKLFGSAVAAAVFAVILGFTGSASAQQPGVPMVGGFKTIALDNADVQAAAQFAVDAFNEKEETTLELDSVFTAKYQVVTGMNYRIGIVTFFPDPDGNPVYYCVEAQVYRDLKKNYSLKAWNEVDCPEFQ